MILSNKRITKAQIRLRGCEGWSAHMLVANTEDRFSHVEAQLCIVCFKGSLLEFSKLLITFCCCISSGSSLLAKVY